MAVGAIYSRVGWSIRYDYLAHDQTSGNDASKAKAQFQDLGDQLSEDSCNWIHFVQTDGFHPDRSHTQCSGSQLQFEIHPQPRRLQTVQHTNTTHVGRIPPLGIGRIFVPGDGQNSGREWIVQPRVTLTGCPLFEGKLPMKLWVSARAIPADAHILSEAHLSSTERAQAIKSVIRIAKELRKIASEKVVELGGEVVPLKLPVEGGNNREIEVSLADTSSTKFIDFFNDYTIGAESGATRETFNRFTAEGRLMVSDLVRQTSSHIDTSSDDLLLRSLDRDIQCAYSMKQTPEISEVVGYCRSSSRLNAWWDPRPAHGQAYNRSNHEISELIEAYRNTSLTKSPSRRGSAMFASYFAESYENLDLILPESADAPAPVLG